MLVSRRSALLGLTAAVTFGRASLALAAMPTSQRFIVIILRGALDGMSAVEPYGDADFAALRGALALPQPGAPGGVLDLGGFYGLHPSLVNLHAMYAAGQALPIHAVAGHYRSRSHFEAQDYLESGVDQRLMSGWLNRAVATMPAAPGHEIALSIGLSAPLMLRGAAPVEAWAPDHFAQPEADLYARLVSLSRYDPIIGPALSEGIRERGLSITAMGGSNADPKHDHSFEALSGAAGRLLAAPSGPRVAVLEIGGWDTHAAQVHRLAVQLKELDDGLGALRAGLGDAWPHTMIVAVTEFGRTARVNGTQGTDHGTGGVAVVVGGAVAGGRVLADWPGLGQGKLFENRDLAPTLDLRAVLKGGLRDHMGLSSNDLNRVFPGSTAVSPMGGLVRS
jgi:uncharacterized protein (DUF1501 family)